MSSTTPQSLNQSDLDNAAALLNAGDVAGYYEFLHSKGYDYGALAGDVVRDEGLWGTIANQFLENTVESSGDTLTEAERDDLVAALAAEDLNQRQLLLDSAVAQGSSSAVVKLSGTQIKNYHHSVYDQQGIAREGWTGSAPAEILGTEFEIEWDQWLDNADGNFVEQVIASDRTTLRLYEEAVRDFDIFDESTWQDAVDRVVEVASWRSDVALAAAEEAAERVTDAARNAWEEGEQQVENYWDSISKWWRGNDDQSGETDYESIYAGDHASGANDPDDPCLDSPIIIDFDGDVDGDGFAIELTNFEQAGAYFDIDNDGFRERISWMSGTGQAFLAIDSNQNGLIDNQLELFGQRGLHDAIAGNERLNGFAVLEDYDSNADGKIDASDTIWSDLLLWYDIDGDGTSTGTGELEEISVSTVASIDLQNADHKTLEDYVTLDEGFVIAESTVSLSGGGTAGAYDISFFGARADTIAITSPGAELTGVASLAATGEIYELAQVANSNAALAGLLNDLDTLQSTEIDSFMQLVDDVIFEWAGNSFTEINQNGFLSSGALDLLSTAYGFEYFSVGEYEEALTGGASTYDATIAARQPGMQPTIRMNELWNEFYSSVSAKLAVQTILSGQNLDLSYDLATDSIAYSGDPANSAATFDLFLDWVFQAGAGATPTLAETAERFSIINPIRRALDIDEITAQRAILEHIEDAAIFDDAFEGFANALVAMREEGNFLSDASANALALEISLARHADFLTSTFWESVKKDAQIIAVQSDDAFHANEYENIENDLTLNFNDGSVASVDIERESVWHDRATIEGAGHSVDKFWVSGFVSEIVVGDETSRIYLGTGQHTIVDNGQAAAVLSISLDYSGADLHLDAEASDISIRDLSLNGRRGQRITVEDTITSAVEFNLADSADTVVSALGNDTISAGEGDDAISAGGGDDRLFGGEGLDLLFGDTGADLIEGESGNDSIFGGAGNDTIRGEAIGDTVNTGNDFLFGDAGDDIVKGDNGNDTVNGGLGSDSLYGGDGFDWLSMDSRDEGFHVNLNSRHVFLNGVSEDRVYEFEGVIGSGGDDTIRGSAADESFMGLVGDDSLIGNDGDDTLAGGVGDDSLLGGTGEDVLLGDYGVDRLNGGAGADTFIFSQEANNSDVDIAEDFAVGTDVVKLLQITLLDFSEVDTDSDGTNDATQLNFVEGNSALLLGVTGVTHESELGL